ncbi:sugar transferase (plasmid) [Streptomyces sp. NBC_00015]|uniref:sugar transferase n=1 Tax=Streptomyces sp. NBC_00015 TaxID=2903611 RepID=UPI002F90AF74
MEERDKRVRHTIPQQADASFSDDSDPVGEALLAGYLSQVEEAAAQIITPQKTDDLLLRIKVRAYTQAAVESHQSGDDTLTNLVVQRDQLIQADTAPPPASRRQGKTGLRLAASAQLAATAIALLQLQGDAANTASDVAVIFAMTAAFVLTALMLWRRPRRRRPLPGLSCQSAALSRSRRAVDVAVAVTALLVTAPAMVAASMSVAVKGRPVIERNVRVGQGGYPIHLLKYRLDPRPSRINARLQVFEHFPRLWNLLRGDLTLVGPKPEPPEVAELYPEGCRWVFQHRPGLIGAVYEDADEQEADTDRYLAEVVPAQVNMYKCVLFNERLAPRLLGNAAIAMLVFRPGNGRRLGVPAPEDRTEQPRRTPPAGHDQEAAGREHFRLERWSLHETVSA